ncbi:MAG TPA: hypothetical protein VFS31_04895, partial [Chitinophagaceae bacterium]|nr:hypothetical protein [Chitinophagaceae bacterium]
MTRKQHRGIGILMLYSFLSVGFTYNSHAQKVFGVPGTNNYYGPVKCLIDKHNNLYWNNNGGIDKKDGTTGTVSHIAGTGTYGHTGNGGQATSARIDALISMALDETNNILYFAEQNNNYIRKIDLTTGIINDYMGTGNSGSANDISIPTALAIDNNGNLYYGNATAVFKINISTGAKTAFAGIEHYGGYSGNGGLATSAHIDYVNDIKADALGDVYIAEGGNRIIRKIDVNGYISLIAGAGSSPTSNSGSGGPATSAYISPNSLALDSHGTIYLASGLYIRRITSDGIITDVAGTGLGTPSNGLCSDPSSTNIVPLCLAFDSYGDLYFSDGTNG